MKKLSRLLLMTFLCTILIQIQAFAAELQLNPDALYGVVRNNNQEQSLRLDQLFITSKSVYTYDELKECLRKYGTVVISEEEGGWYETIVDEQGKPIIRFFFEVGFNGNSYPSDWEFPVEFYSPGDLFWSETLPSYHVDSAVDSEAFIERVSQINHGWNLDGWHWDNNGYWTYYHNNVKNVNIWDNIEGKWYYFKEDGSMVHSGLHEINGNLYYFAESSAMETDWHKIPDDESGSWYYFSPQSGALMGAALKGGPHDIAGQKYQFEQDGTLIWDKIVQGNDGVLHYYTKGGPMLFGAADGSTKVTVEGVEYVIDSKGVARVARESFDSIINRLKNKYPAGDTMDNVGKDIVVDGQKLSNGGKYSFEFDSSWSCIAYAKLMIYEVFKEHMDVNTWPTTYRTEDPTLSNVKPGDYLLFHRLDGEDHAIFVTGVDSENIYFTDANWGTANIIRWDQSISKNKLLTDNDYSFTLYRHAPNYEDVFPIG